MLFILLEWIKIASRRVKKSKRQKGTFYASSLFWSGKDNELYLNGTVRVNVGDNNFKGNGSFTFLGPVYLLFVNDKQMALNETMELSAQRYFLKALSNDEATKKYGEKGRQGVVEITVVE
jgi:hypothetical protein